MITYMRSLAAAATVILIAHITVAAQFPPKETKPYKIITTGKQLTIRSNKALDKIMVWTTDGHRIVEQKGIRSNVITLTVPVYRPYYFVMIGLNDGKIYTEKIAM